jgi:hypothetical protein
MKKTFIVTSTLNPNPIPSPRSFVLLPAVILQLRGAVSKQDIADTKAPICTNMIYTVTPKDSQPSSCKLLFVGIMYHQIMYMMRI